MVARVQLTEDAREDLRDLEGSARKSVIKGLKKLEAAPGQYGEPLGSRQSGNLTGFRKLIVGNKTYRIIYWVQDNAENDDVDLVVVWVIAERADDQAYDLALSRLQMMQHREVANDLERLLVAVWRG